MNSNNNNSKSNIIITSFIQVRFIHTNEKEKRKEKKGNM